MQNQKLSVLLIFLIFSNVIFSDNLFSRLYLSATNQKLTSLENVSFFIECESEKWPPPIFPTHGKSFLCSSDETGICFPEICYGCPANSIVKISAKYYSEDQNQMIEKWTGYTYAGPLNGECLYFRSPPSNELQSFTFTTYNLKIKVIDETNKSLDNVTAIINSPPYLYKKCKTNMDGECYVKNLPTGTYGIHVILNESENETITVIDNDKTIELTLVRNIESLQNITIEWNNTKIPVIENHTIQNISIPQPVENNSMNWFMYIMNKTDELIGKEKKKTPKLKLVFVPINWNSTDSISFNNSVEEQTNVFFDRYPIGSCREKVKIIKIGQNCPIVNWTCGRDHCSVDGVTTDMDAIRKCALNALGTDSIEDNMYIIGLTHDDVCSGISGQSCRQKVMWSQTDDLLVTSHELGHEFYLTEEYNSLRNGPPNKLTANYGCDPTNATCCFDTCVSDPPNVCCYGNLNSEGGRCIMSYSGADEPRYFDPGDMVFFNTGNLDTYPRLSQIRC
ncbi:MAG: hypothetical protein Q7S22_07790 [Candidatus Micrarchaeota archaeon]|nr:hypothetical protein [Candidatus Micrarchaeota archaeon]